MGNLNALVVDDSVLYRRILTDTLSAITDVESVVTAHSGKSALEKLARDSFDFVTLDFEMPGMDGLEVLEKIHVAYPDVKVIMVSAHTVEGAAITMKALEKGAYDFLAKPHTSSMSESCDCLVKQLRPLVHGLSFRCNIRRTHKKIPVKKVVESRQKEELQIVASRMKRVYEHASVSVVGVAISTGGPNALADVIPKLPGSLKVPVVIVQHMPPVFTKALADSLNSKSLLTVVEAEEGMILKPGWVYIAPGGKQMKIKRYDELPTVHITDDPPENNCKPAADYMFRSLASVYRGNVLGVIMTGMGCDGVAGLTILKKFGARVLAQDQETSVVYGMPMEAMKAGVVDKQLPLESIAHEIAGSIR